MHKTLWLLGLTLSFLGLHVLGFADQAKQDFLQKSNQSIADYSQRMLSFYQLGPQEQWRDVTEQVLASSDTSAQTKEQIRSHQRRLIVFKYPSDGLWVKGFISFTPNPEHHPLLILFRTGNREFALMNPGADLANYGNYTTISSALRGGVSEGQDEFGGADVRDIKHLIDYLPTLAQELNISLHPHCVYMLGPSRGGLEMFLALARYPGLQLYVNKVVALSSILDLNKQIADRPHDMKEMFKQDFGLREGVNDQEWIAQRNPLQTIPYLRKNLPILIIQGTADKRISLEEGYHMVQELQKQGRQVDYWEYKGGEHTLSNVPQLMDQISGWLAAHSTC